MNENDPFLNLNNSGATNLLLGQNDINEATVVNNGYSGQYGQPGGANVNYVTKAAEPTLTAMPLFWNGRVMNANNYFNNSADRRGRSTTRTNGRQRLVDRSVKTRLSSSSTTEGLRAGIPTGRPVNIPSPQFQAATHGEPGDASPRSIPSTRDVRALERAPECCNARNVLPTGTDTTAPRPARVADRSRLRHAQLRAHCNFPSTAGNFTHEFLVTARLDQNIGNNDRLFRHFRTDHGLQATFTDPINPLFNAQSDQPQYEGQLKESHTFSATMVNQFIVSGSWYSALFSPANLSAATQFCRSDRLDGEGLLLAGSHSTSCRKVATYAVRHRGRPLLAEGQSRPEVRN